MLAALPSLYRLHDILTQGHTKYIKQKCNLKIHLKNRTKQTKQNKIQSLDWWYEFVSPRKAAWVLKRPSLRKTKKARERKT